MSSNLILAKFHHWFLYCAFLSYFFLSNCVLFEYLSTIWQWCLKVYSDVMNFPQILRIPGPPHWTWSVESHQISTSFVFVLFMRLWLLKIFLCFLDILFGLPWQKTGISRYFIRNKQRTISFAVTIVLKKYDQR